MPLLEDHTASFIVRVWRERGESPSAPGDWRGSIEHVTSGRRVFFRDLAAIAQFMKPHLAELGIDPASRFWDLMSSDEPATADAPSAPAAEPLQPVRTAPARNRKRRRTPRD